MRDFRIYFGTIYGSPVRANVSGIFNKNKSGLRVWSKILFIIGPHLLIRVGLVVNETMNFVVVVVVVVVVIARGVDLIAHFPSIFVYFFAFPEISSSISRCLKMVLFVILGFDLSFNLEISVIWSTRVLNDSEISVSAVAVAVAVKDA